MCEKRFPMNFLQKHFYGSDEVWSKAILNGFEICEEFKELKNFCRFRLTLILFALDKGANKSQINEITIRHIKLT